MFENSGYTFSLTNLTGPGEDKWLIGVDVDEYWDIGTGLIYLGTDDILEPLGTLTMTIGAQFDSVGVLYVDILDATLSTTDVRVGNAWELNARLYQLKEPTIVGAYRNVIQISSLTDTRFEGFIYMRMERVIVHTTDTPETIKVDGDFAAFHD